MKRRPKRTARDRMRLGPTAFEQYQANAADARDRRRAGEGMKKRGVITYSSLGFSASFLEQAAAASGVVVSAGTAMRLAAVYAAVRILGETIGSLPLFQFSRRDDKGKDRVTDTPQSALVHDNANPIMTSTIWRETKQAIVSLWGNTYSRLERDARGRAIEAWPLPAGGVKPIKKVEDRLIYRITDHDGSTYTLRSDELLHVPGLGFNGIEGISPIRWARQAIGLGLAAEEHGARLFGQGARPSGVLEYAGTLDTDKRDELTEAWNAAYGGPTNANKVAILEAGLKWNPISIPPEDAQFLETRKFQVTEIARIFRIPPHMLADLERATFSNIEHQAIDFVVYTLLPWLVRWEQELNRKLLNGGERGRFFFQFVVDGLLRGDVANRYKAYAIGRNWGWLSANDIRRLENMNPIEGGDAYLTPVNMTTVGMDDDMKALVRRFEVIDGGRE